MLSVLRAVSYYQYNTFRLQFDTSCKLQLTAEQRIQQLSGEKERLDYERVFALKREALRAAPLDASDVDGLCEPRDASLPPIALENAGGSELEASVATPEEIEMALAVPAPASEHTD